MQPLIVATASLVETPPLIPGWEPLMYRIAIRYMATGTRASPLLSGVGYDPGQEPSTRGQRMRM